jgi:hypothetical protein
MFSRRDLKQRHASDRIVERIDRKHRGGRSGSAGYRQEDFFAVCKMIVRLAPMSFEELERLL